MDKGMLEKLRLSPELATKRHRINGNTYEEMDCFSYLNLYRDGRVVAVFKDDTTMDVSELFPQELIGSYQSHQILIPCRE